MRRVAFAVAIVLQFANPFTATVNAQATADGSESGRSASSAAGQQQPQTPSTETGTEGREFGQHVAGMAPEHPLLHGVLFGNCVSELAITGECPHDHE